MSTPERAARQKYVGAGIAAGAGVGAAMGAALGNVALGIAPGIAVGVAVGLLFARRVVARAKRITSRRDDA